MLDKILDVVVIDCDIAGGSVAGSVSESIVHPKKGKDIFFHFTRALLVGWALAVFVSPAVSERFKLSKSESVAIAFIGGYCGIKILSTAEKVIHKKITSETKD
tara:strand:- start:364 stop:672 length:309 start_codon:yes stop_codon:yes gene_type:complete